MIDKALLAEAAQDLHLELDAKAGADEDVDFLLSNAWMMDRLKLAIERRIGVPERFLLGRWLLDSNLPSDRETVDKLARFAQLLQGNTVP